MFGDPGGGLAALEAFQRDYLSPSSRADPSPSMVGSSPVSGMATPCSLGTQGTPGPLSSMPPTPPRANSSSPAASFQPGSGSFEEQFKEVNRECIKVHSSLDESDPKQYETELKS